MTYATNRLVSLLCPLAPTSRSRKPLSVYRERWLVSREHTMKANREFTSFGRINAPILTAFPFTRVKVPDYHGE